MRLVPIPPRGPLQFREKHLPCLFLARRWRLRDHARVSPCAHARARARPHSAACARDMKGLSTIALALAAFATFFATIGPVDCAVIFASLTARYSPASQMRTAL